MGTGPFHCQARSRNRPLGLAAGNSGRRLAAPPRFQRRVAPQPYGDIPECHQQGIVYVGQMAIVKRNGCAALATRKRCGNGLAVRNVPVAGPKVSHLTLWRERGAKSEWKRRNAQCLQQTLLRVSADSGTMLSGQSSVVGVHPVGK